MNFSCCPGWGSGQENRGETEIREGRVGDGEQIRLALTPNKEHMLRPKDYCGWTELMRQV